jgi:TrmH family RNA methyltransferase
MMDAMSIPSPAPADLTSLANPRIKAARALRVRRDRDRAGQTLIDGARELRRALDAGVVIDEVFVHDASLAGADARAVLDAIRDKGIPIQRVSEPVLTSLAFGERAEGLVAVARIPSSALDELKLPAEPLIVVLERVEKPGNVGAVLRTADGAGADAVIAASPRTDLFNPNVIRASAGTVFTVPLAAASTDEVVGWLKERGIAVIAARVDATVPYTDADLRGPVAIVLGAEVDGLTDAWAGADTLPVRLPMHGVADSLNVSVSAAVLLYEARRQRDLPTRQTKQRGD